MQARTVWLAGIWWACISSTWTWAQEARYYQDPATGQTMRATTQVTHQPVQQTQMQPREYTYYRERYTTELQDVQRSYQIPITEYRWEQRVERGWNPFATPYLTYKLVPQTRYETRVETVKVPVSRRELVPEKITHYVPVTTQQYVKTEIVTHVPVPNNTPGAIGGAQVASNPTATPAAQPTTNTPIGGMQQISSQPKWRPEDLLQKR